MKNSIWDKRIPTLFGIFLLIIGVISTSMLVQNGVITIGNATPSEIPQNVRITNVTDTSFSVSYITEAQSVGSISYGTDTNYGSTAFDDRDQKTNDVKKYNVHYITIRNLKPETTYFFVITSSEKRYLHNNAPFQVVTGRFISDDPSSENPASGRVLLPDGLPPKEAVVYLGSEEIQNLSVLIKQDGSYIIPLNAVRTNDLSRYASFSAETSFNLLVSSGSMNSNVILLANQMNPIPLITLSKNYDFTITTAPVASPSAETTFPSFSSTAEIERLPQLLTPKKDERFTDPQPLFKGTAPPGSDVTITIHSSEEIKTQITADTRGNWSFRPDSPLTPGEHTVLITVSDPSGLLKTIQQSFTVYAEGTQIAAGGTPFITPTPTPIKTPTPTIQSSTPTTSPLPTATPFSPSPQISKNPTVTTPTSSATPSVVTTTLVPTQPISNPGSSSVLLFGALSVFFILTGTALLFAL